MAKKITRKKYTVTARFEVWVEKTVQADSVEDALSMAQAASLSDFMDLADDVELVDANRIDGTGVREEWT